MSTDRPDVETLAEVLGSLPGKRETETFGQYDRRRARAVLASDRLADHDARVRAEADERVEGNDRMHRALGQAKDRALRRVERERAEAEHALAALQAAVRGLADDPDDTQWWEVVPYMDPPERDEVVEVQVVSADRLRATLTDTAALDRAERAAGARALRDAADELDRRASGGTAFNAAAAVVRGRADALEGGENQ